MVRDLGLEPDGASALTPRKTALGRSTIDARNHRHRTPLAAVPSSWSAFLARHSAAHLVAGVMPVVSVMALQTRPRNQPSGKAVLWIKPRRHLNAASVTITLDAIAPRADRLGAAGGLPARRGARHLDQLLDGERRRHLPVSGLAG